MAYKHVKAWRARNANLVKEQERQYKRLTRGPRRTLLNRVLAAYGGACLRCGSVVKVCADHVTPLNISGSDSIENIQPLCMICNVARSKTEDRAKDYRPDHGERIKAIAAEWEAEMRADGRWRRMVRGKTMRKDGKRGRLVDVRDGFPLPSIYPRADVSPHQ